MQLLTETIGAWASSDLLQEHPDPINTWPAVFSQGWPMALLERAGLDQVSKR
jgi:hypothetical protein